MVLYYCSGSNPDLVFWKVAEFALVLVVLLELVGQVVHLWIVDCLRKYDIRTQTSMELASFRR